MKFPLAVIFRMTLFPATCSLSLHADVITFDVATDFSFANNTESSTWSYRYATDLERDGDYLLYTTVNPIADPFTVKPSVWNDGDDGSPAWVGKNTTGGDQISGGGNNWNWQADDVMFHPGVGRLSVISWLAPQSGTLTLNYQLSDDISGGPVSWFIEQNSSVQTLANGSLTSQATTGPQQLSTTVAQGDRINFLLDPIGSIGTDAVVINASLSLQTNSVPEPATLQKCLFAVVGLAVLFAKKRANHQREAHDH